MRMLLMGILYMSITGGIVILLVLLIRLLLKRAPKVFSYALWSVVLLRLLCPVALSSDFSLFRLVDVRGMLQKTGVYSVLTGAPDVQTDMIKADIKADDAEAAGTSGITRTTGDMEASGIADDVGASGNAGAVGDIKIVGDAEADRAAAAAQMVTGTEKQTIGPSVFSEITEQAMAQPVMIRILSVIWLSGIAVMLIYIGLSSWRLKKKLVGAYRLYENVYLSDYVEIPFAAGVLHPRIYLPSGLPEEKREIVLMHERAHIRRGDHIIKLLAFMALTIHWFNPLVWIAFILSSRDMEMSCDEAVIRGEKEDFRAAYCELLLNLSAGKGLMPGMPLSFGEGDTGKRIRNIMKYQKPAFWILAAACIILLAAAVTLGSNPHMETSGQLSEGMQEAVQPEDGGEAAGVVQPEDSEEVVGIVQPEDSGEAAGIVQPDQQYEAALLKKESDMLNSLHEYESATKPEEMIELERKELTDLKERSLQLLSASTEYERFLEQLSGEFYYALVEQDGLEFPVLLISEGVYEDIDGTPVSIDSTAYYFFDGTVCEVGRLRTNGTAYPVRSSREGFFLGGRIGVARVALDLESRQLQWVEEAYWDINENEALLHQYKEADAISFRIR